MTTTLTTSAVIIVNCSQGAIALALLSSRTKVVPTINVATICSAPSSTPLTASLERGTPCCPAK